MLMKESGSDIAIEAPNKSRSIPRPLGVDNQSRWLWPYLSVVAAFHALVALALFPYFFSWWGVLWLPVGNLLFCSLGIGAGYHRLLTHRGFQCPLWFEHFLAILGVCNLQDTPARWVLVHRLHHQYSDERPDPHTPKVSWFWSHVGWLFVENRELDNASSYDKYARDLLRDPLYMKLQRSSLFVWVYAVHALLFYLLGSIVGSAMVGTLAGSFRVGLMWLLWGAIYRTVYTWHVTWGINSFSHMLGYRNYDTNEDSRNNWLFAVATNGEGWHNNHHADPRSVAHGHRWWEIDVTYRTICLWEQIGLVWDVARPNPSLLRRRSMESAG